MSSAERLEMKIGCKGRVEEDGNSGLAKDVVGCGLICFVCL